ncbi:MAG: helix-turn-helix transcriptional regulator [bacterium]
MGNNLDSELKLNHVAEKIGLSSGYLRKLVKKNLRMNYQYLLNKLRIEKAKQMLCESSDNIGEISFKVGFKNQQHFTRIFRQFTELSPKEFRNK